MLLTFVNNLCASRSILSHRPREPMRFIASTQKSTGSLRNLDRVSTSLCESVFARWYPQLKQEYLKTGRIFCLTASGSAGLSWSRMNDVSMFAILNFKPISMTQKHELERSKLNCGVSHQKRLARFWSNMKSVNDLWYERTI